jgi:hypothetical protein
MTHPFYAGKLIIGPFWDKLGKRLWLTAANIYLSLKINNDKGRK